MSLIKNIILTLICYLVVTSSFAANKIISCDNCSSDTTRKNLAKAEFAWNENGDIYIIDADNRVGYKYNVYTDYIQEGSEELPILAAVNIGLTADEEQGVDAIFDLYDYLVANSSSIVTSTGYKKPELRKEVLNSSTSVIMLNNSNDVPLRAGEIIVSENITAYDFISSSLVQSQLYADIVNNIDNSIWVGYANTAIQTLNIQNSFMRDLKLSYEVTFSDGSSALIYLDSSLETTGYIEGSVRDMDGNTIPTSPASVPGNYFVSDENLDAFNNYLNSMGINISGSQSCALHSTTCYIDGNNYVCFLDDCAY